MKDRIPYRTEALEGADDYSEVIAYDRGASTFMAPMHWLAARTVRKLLRKHEAYPMILDIGTGTGRFAFMAMKTNPGISRTIGLDLSGNMLKRAQELSAQKNVHNLNLVRANADALPFKDGVFDVVVSAQSLHHWNKPVQVFKEADRVVKDKGSAAIFDGKRPTSWLGRLTIRVLMLFMNRRHREQFPKVYGSSYTIPEARAMLSDAGLDKWKVKPDLGWMGLKIIRE